MPPVWPEAARVAGVVGTVGVQVLVGTDGRVHGARVTKSIPMLDKAALEAARTWFFKPGLLGGKPVAVWFPIGIEFPSPQTQEKKHELIPAFTDGRDEPSFVVEYTNEADTTADLVTLMSASSITLDDTTHARVDLKFAGNMRLAPGATWSFVVSPAEYVLGATRRAYDPVLRRQLWRLPLRPGLHRMTLRFGGGVYGPVTFAWRDSTGMLPQAR